MKSTLKIGIQCLLIIFSAFLVSCTSSSNNPQENSQQTESTGQIVNKYVDTLTTAQDKAKKAASAENRRVEEESKAVEEMGKQ
jgi:hypothetical protein